MKNLLFMMVVVYNLVPNRRQRDLKFFFKLSNKEKFGASNHTDVLPIKRNE